MLSSISLKFYIYAALFVGAIFFFMRYDYLSEENKTLKKENVRLEADATEKERIARITDIARNEANQKLEAVKDEISKRDACIASGDCKRVVRVKTACTVPETATTSGATEGFAELASSVQRAASDFEIRLAEHENRLAICYAYARSVSELPLQDERK